MSAGGGRKTKKDHVGLPPRRIFAIPQFGWSRISELSRQRSRAASSLRRLEQILQAQDFVIGIDDEPVENSDARLHKRLDLAGEVEYSDFRVLDARLGAPLDGRGDFCYPRRLPVIGGLPTVQGRPPDQEYENDDCDAEDDQRLACGQVRGNHRSLLGRLVVMVVPIAMVVVV
ncbi:MAG: hypothetical protein ACM3U2_15375 [Deltaproteobacteria bacterium]